MIVFLGSVPRCHGDLAIFLCSPSLSVGGGNFLLLTLDAHGVVPNNILAAIVPKLVKYHLLNVMLRLKPTKKTLYLT